MPISWPAATIRCVSSGKVSIECPGMNQVVFSPYFSNSFSRRSDPTSPANSPREMSSGESSPPYEPSHPATASTSTPMQQKISFAIRPSLSVVQRYDMCALCGVLMEDHWAEREGGRRGRALRVGLVNRVLAVYGL